MSYIAYEELLKPERFAKEKTNTEIENSLSSDKSRVIFSSAFRRLQQKAQVFGLEKNASVRSRLTHTLEVANTGSLLAKKIVNELIEKKQLDEKYRVPFIDITETCCLLHDIGNPPFGHFGEAAIQKWFSLNWKKTYIVSTGVDSPENDLSERYINDFIHFDGNPQGVRICLHLAGLPEDDEGVGLNLTYSQIISSIKYNANPDDVEKGKSKKAGYFHSEADKISKVKEYLKWDKRFPITFLMEAADDISYCISDIEDGIEKGVITPESFFAELRSSLKDFNPEEFDIPDFSSMKTKHDFFIFKIRLTRSLIQKASDVFLASQESISKGIMSDILDKDEQAKKILSALKSFSKIHLFRSREAEDIELAGYKIIFGLLECYLPLLELPKNKFDKLKLAIKNPNELKNEKLDIEWRLFNRLPKKQLDAYQLAISKINNDKWKEWYYRAHLIVDYIAGMTDNFALETYRLLNGITI